MTEKIRSPSQLCASLPSFPAEPIHFQTQGIYAFDVRPMPHGRNALSQASENVITRDLVRRVAEPRPQRFFN